MLALRGVEVMVGDNADRHSRSMRNGDFLS